MHSETAAEADQAELRNCFLQGLLVRFSFILPWPFRRNPSPAMDLTDRWFVELDGKPIAMLANPAFHDMFWFTWELIPLPDTLIPDDLWDYANDRRRSFRHAATGEVNSMAFPAGPHAAFRDGRVLLRSLYRNAIS